MQRLYEAGHESFVPPVQTDDIFLLIFDLLKFEFKFSSFFCGNLIKDHTASQCDYSAEPDEAGHE